MVKIVIDEDLQFAFEADWYFDEKDNFKTIVTKMPNDNLFP